MHVFAAACFWCVLGLRRSADCQLQCLSPPLLTLLQPACRSRSFVCPTEITAFSDRYEEFKALNTEVRRWGKWEGCKGVKGVLAVVSCMGSMHSGC